MRQPEALPVRIREAGWSPERDLAPIGRCAGRLLVAGSLFVSQVASAGPPPPPAPDQSSDEQSIERARELHERAQTRYEMYDYLSAIEYWMEAYRLLRADDSTRDIRNAIVWNIATARIKAYEVDKDVRHLHQGLLLLRKYLKEYTDIYGAGGGETEKIQKKVEELDSMIKSSSADEPTPDAPFPGGKGGARGGGDEGAGSGGGASKKDRPAPIGGVGYAGIASSVVGLGFAGMWIYGMLQGKTWRDRFEQYPLDREEITEQGNKANMLSVIGGAGTGLFLAAGVAMIVVDQTVLKKRRKAKASALLPVLAPHLAGVTWSMSF